MSARSPRGSISGPSSAEVAEDFAESLKDLQINNRYEITNLTIIAKENTEHAQAISRVLENHIKTTAPSRKLIALYVLDSIVKNVGTPYTLYLGTNLYSTFMEAYTLVDGQTRRSMEGVLKTWKEPIAGSIDPRPVFPPEIVRPIENALIKARTAALQNQRQVPQPAYRSTPTPPQHMAFGAPPNSQGPQQPIYGQTGLQAPHQFPPHFQPTPNQQQQVQFYRPPSQNPPNDVETIKHDLATLIAASRSQFSTNPFDQALQKRLQALLQLEDVVNRQRLSDADLQTIRNQLSAMSVGSSSLPAARPTPPPSSVAPSQWLPPQPAPQSQPPQFITPLPPYSHPPAAQSHPAAPLFPPGALNGLQALLANNQKPGTPQMRAAAPALQNASHSQLQSIQTQTAAVPTLNGADLIAALSKTGLIPPPNSSITPQPSVPAPAQPPIPSTVDLLRSLQGKIQPLSQISTPPQTTTPLAQSTSKPRIPMTSSALKTFQPALVHGLYEAQPNQCSTCGRRFLANDEGRAKKQRHLDWHFRTNQRLADANLSRATAAHHRLFYPDELPWVRQRDFDVSTTSADDIDAHAAAAGAASRPHRPEDESVPAPPGVTKNTCSICFEDMKSAYNEERQAWVFMNAKKHGGRIVHATCLAEMQKGTGSVAAGASALLSSAGAGLPGTTASSGGAVGALAPAGNPSSLAAMLAGLTGGLAPNSTTPTSRQRSATPDLSLGKRKAEGPPLAAAGNSSARLRTE